MYDPKQEPHEFVGEDRETALAKAVAFFGTEASELRVRHYEGVDVHGLRGRSGGGGRAQGRQAAEPEPRRGRSWRGS